MPLPKLLSLQAASERIAEMLEATASPDSPGFSHACFDAPTLRLVSASRSDDARTASITVEMLVTPPLANQLNNLHGGAAASLLDNVTSFALYLHTSGEAGSPWSYLGVSSSINIAYLAPMPVGAWCDMVCETRSVGKNLAVIQFDMWHKDGPGAGAKRIRRTSTGTHTKVDNSAQFKL